MSDRDGGSHRPAADDARLAARLNALDRRLDERRAKRAAAAAAAGGGRALGPGVARGLRLATDFVAGVLLGAALGWGFDRLFGTSPWGLIVFLLLGFAAGILSVFRSAGMVAEGPLRPREPGESPRVDHRD